MRNRFEKRSSNFESLNEIISQVLKNQNLEKQLNDKDIIDAWKKIAGNAFLQYTSKAEAKNGILYLSLSSSVVRNELMMAKQFIIKKLNKELNSDIVKEIIFK